MYIGTTATQQMNTSISTSRYATRKKTITHHLRNILLKGMTINEKNFWIDPRCNAHKI